MENIEKMEYLEPCLERHFTGHSAAITQVRFNPCGDLLATSSVDASVILWDLKQAARCIRFDAHTAPVCDVAWAPEGNLVASCSKDRSIKIWEPKVRGVSSELLAHTRAVSSVDFDITGCWLVSGSHDKSIKLWRVATQRFVSAFSAHTNWVRSTRFSPDGQLIASCSDDRTVRVFDVRSGECTRTFCKERGINSIPHQIAWHPAGTMLAVALSCGRIKIYDIAEDELIQFYMVHAGTVNEIAFHPSGNFMLSSSDDATLKLLDLLEGRPIYTLTGHASEVNTATFSSDGCKFASAGADRQLLTWKSNLHAFNMTLFEERQLESLSALSLEQAMDSASSTSTHVDTALLRNPAIDPNTIVIDPRQSAEFRFSDENVQVHAIRPPTATPTLSLPLTQQKSIRNMDNVHDKSVRDTGKYGNITE